MPDKSLQTDSITCRHCSGDIVHKVNCKCSHIHNDHVFASGCKVKDCNCERYDQSSARKEQAIRKENTETNLAVATIDIEKLESQTIATLELAKAQERLEVLRLKKKLVKLKSHENKISVF